ncbi:cytidine deaminase-like protein [Gonapodya prolifera JEL478]|uniref:Cytidine deaminase-like protein n=1 Tax=Gonapodya prolifera (strain JEL478) TaxID=1344416 RepID=A0A139AZD1_GONPJ|nr:cytidine deaminase-like protein [Gonapodya prolifera JEL478]|eukprot:KXS22060.1 cytidine deaminase-like protein [Gonapodya prolifera JEL478]
MTASTTYASTADAPFVPNADHMLAAIEIGTKNPRFPFGSVIVDVRSNEIVGTGLNNNSKDPTNHGEVNAIRNLIAASVAATDAIPDFDNLALYTTAEPCIMCCGSIMRCGFRSVVFGASIPFLRSRGYMQTLIPCKEIIARSEGFKCGVCTKEDGVIQFMEKECEAIFPQDVGLYRG